MPKGTFIIAHSSFENCSSSWPKMVTHGPLSEVFDPLSFGFDGSDIMFLISRQSDPSLFLAPDANIVVILVWAVSYTSSVVPGGGGGRHLL